MKDLSASTVRCNNTLRWTAIATVLFTLNLHLLPVTAQTTQPATVQNSFKPNEVDRAIERGLAYLATEQREDGAVTDRQYDTTMTALTVMAFAATGATPSSPKQHGKVCRQALDFVLKSDRQDEHGYYGNRDGSRMYGHGIVTLMLTEMLGMGADKRQNELIHARCEMAIDLILSAQSHSKPRQYQGGWRYTPNSNDSDLSVSVWQLMALRSAKNDGLAVPASAIAAAVDYLERSYTARLDSQRQPVQEVAGFSYLPNNQNATYAMTSAGLLAMQVCGRYDSPLAEGATQWLLDHPPKWNERFFFYGTYYYAQGMHQRGGEIAEKANKLVADILLEHQQPDGSWVAPSGEEMSSGKVYSTCMAILSLSVKHHYLPIYQR